MPHKYTEDDQMVPITPQQSLQMWAKHGLSEQFIVAVNRVINRKYSGSGIIVYLTDILREYRKIYYGLMGETTEVEDFIQQEWDEKVKPAWEKCGWQVSYNKENAFYEFEIK